MQQIKVYVSAKIEHAPMLAGLHVDGFHINARWIEMAESGRRRLKPVTHWQQENFDDIRAAHFFILYAEPADELKGSIGETFYAIANDKKCWIAGNADKAGDGWGLEVTPDGAANSIRVANRGILPWGHFRQNIRMVSGLAKTFSDIREFVRPNYTKDAAGGLIPAQEF